MKAKKRRRKRKGGGREVRGGREIGGGGRNGDRRERMKKRCKGRIEGKVQREHGGTTHCCFNLKFRPLTSQNTIQRISRWSIHHPIHLFITLTVHLIQLILWLQISHRSCWNKSNRLITLF
jgi:hypothetical protein